MKGTTEPGNGNKDPITVEMIKSIFIEMFKEQEETLIETAKSTLANRRIEKLLIKQKTFNSI